MNELTSILGRVSEGDEKAAQELLPLVYEDLRKLAAHRMSRLAPGQTLQPTALVHEAWLRLVNAEERTWQNQAHFFAAAAEAMRRVLIDKIRHRLRQKRGGGQQRLDIDGIELAAQTPDDTLLMINDAPYSGGDPELFSCPGWKGIHVGDVAGYATPALNVNSYFYNAFGTGVAAVDGTKAFLGLGSAIPGSYTNKVAESGVLAPSDMIAIGDGGWGWISGFGWPGDLGSAHNGSPNAVFCDAHVESSKNDHIPKELVPGYSGLWRFKPDEAYAKRWNHDNQPHPETWP